MSLISDKGAHITPADVTGVLDANRKDPTAALQQATRQLQAALQKQLRQQAQQQE